MLRKLLVIFFFILHLFFKTAKRWTAAIDARMSIAALFLLCYCWLCVCFTIASHANLGRHGLCQLCRNCVTASPRFPDVYTANQLITETMVDWIVLQSSQTVLLQKKKNAKIAPPKNPLPSVRVHSCRGWTRPVKDNFMANLGLLNSTMSIIKKKR